MNLNKPSENNNNIIYHGNILYGKKYVACGDSFTEGGWLPDDKEEGCYDDELKMYKTYPYWIAKRNNMVLVNEAICGSTLAANKDNHGRTDYFSNTRYKNIPADADYITVKLGINDDSGHHKTPIGTIDDTTNETFYGAWNIVLKYFIENYPKAKIGIIITNGADVHIAEATRQCARKWGFAYLDLDGRYDLPLLHRAASKTEVCEEAKQLRLKQYQISATNTHPNLWANQVESTIVENFLRSL